MNAKQNNNRPLNNNESSLLKTLIYIFYYERNMQRNHKDLLFLGNEYYLINEEWIRKFKNRYNYKKYWDSLNSIEKNNPNINYNNLDFYIDNIIANLYTKDLRFELLNKVTINEEFMHSSTKPYILDNKIMD